MSFLKKSIVYRVYSIAIMGLFFFAITGSVREMTFFTLSVEAVKTVQYYAFEVLWGLR